MSSSRETVDHARRRASPPGPGNEMTAEEISAMVWPLELGYSLEGSMNISPNESGNDSDVEMEDYDGNDDGDDGDGDDDDDDSDSSQFSVPAGEGVADDDPPLRDGPNATTMGFEFELAIAVARESPTIPDPHPNDGRWLSDNLVDKDPEGLAFKYTAKNKIVDTLVAYGVPTQKGEEYWYSVFGEDDRDFQWWDSLEYENPNENDQVLLDWQGNYLWNGLRTDDENVFLAAAALGTQFWQYHRDYNLEPHLTRQAIIEFIRDKLNFMVIGAIPVGYRDRVKTVWFEQVTEYVRDAKRSYYSARGPTDPNLVPDLGVRLQYQSWSVTDDISINNTWTEPQHYDIPGSSLVFDDVTGELAGEPPNLYKWFGAEVVSSVMDYDNPQTFRALKTAAQALRGELRVHKPISIIQTGVHVHIGQQGGWTLLHLKKFATLWHLVEPSMYKLHRKDREESHWCVGTARGCALAKLVYGRNELYSSRGATTTGPKKAAYERQMEQYIPDLSDYRRLRLFLTHIWQFQELNELRDAMQQGEMGTSCIRWRVTGNKLSPRPSQHSIETLEFRMMQGTLDAEHIWKWASVLERLVIFARDSTDDVFRGTIEELLEQNLPASLGLNQNDLQWFRTRTPDGEEYFAYPDNDLVDWGEPFMVQGYGDTHFRTT
ncbi:hypothetical protein F5Y12DRAFT_796049 [Xylaria sp. FL1777]|nr:hypothetical protein F5Y12DRAFT_796049 [Xylaria sp. FL1777]